MNPSILTALVLSGILFLAFITSCGKAIITPFVSGNKKPSESGEKTFPIPVKLSLPEVAFVAVDGQGTLFAATKDTVLFLSNGKTVSHVLKPGFEPTAMTSKNNLLYLGAGDHVEVYDFQGGKKASWSATSSGGIITGISVADEGVYVADAQQKVVFRFTPEGKLLNVIDAKSIGGFVVPSGHFSVADAGDGNVWITNPGKHQIVKFSPQGEVVFSFGAPGLTLDGFNACCNPMSIAVLPDGRIITAEKGRVRVKIYTKEGELDGMIGGTETFGTGIKILSLAIEPDGGVMVTDPVTGETRRFNTIIPLEEFDEG